MGNDPLAADQQSQLDNNLEEKADSGLNGGSSQNPSELDGDSLACSLESRAVMLAASTGTEQDCRLLGCELSCGCPGPIIDGKQNYAETKRLMKSIESTNADAKLPRTNGSSNNHSEASGSWN
jgi:hypothetical protein